MQESIPAIVFGGGLIALGLFLIWQHAHSWRTRRDSGELPQEDLTFFRRQFSRRLQTSGLLVLIGVVLIVGDLALTDQKQPILFTIWVISLLMMVSWIVLLALGDFWAARAHTQAALADVRLQQIAMEREAARLRGQTRSNGNGKTPH